MVDRNKSHVSMVLLALAGVSGCRAVAPAAPERERVLALDTEAASSAAEVITARRAKKKRRRAKHRFRRRRITGTPPQRPARSAERTELRLRGGLFSPMPGGYVAGYPQDTGLDIGGFRLPVYAVASGTLDYSEPGHTRWAGDDDKAVRLELDAPIPYKGRLITHIWYAHLHELTYDQPESSERRIRVKGGERLGTSGVANGSPHLHLGFLLDDWVGQGWGTYLLDDEIRAVIGNYRQRERLPPAPPR